MNTFGRALGLLLTGTFAVTLAGCSGSSDSVQLDGPDPTTLSLAATTPNGLTATLAQDKSTIAVTSGTVNYTLTLTNNGTTDVTVTAPEDAQGQPLPPVTLKIVDSSGSQVFPNASQNPFPTGGPTQMFKLTPKGFLTETITLQGTFRVIGRYRATATFTTGGGATNVGPLTITAR